MPATSAPTKAGPTEVERTAAGALPPALPPPPGKGCLPRLLDELDALQHHLEAQLTLKEYAAVLPMAAFVEAADGRGLGSARGRLLLRSLARHTARYSPPATRAQWDQTRDDMVKLWRHACSELPAETPYAEWMQAVLLAGEFRFAADYLSRDAAQEHINGATAEAVVLEAAREYFDSATSARDPTLERAAECLRVLPLPSDEIAAELRLLQAMKMLDAYGCTLTPLQVRRQARPASRHWPGPWTPTSRPHPHRSPSPFIHRRPFTLTLTRTLTLCRCGATLTGLALSSSWSTCSTRTTVRRASRLGGERQAPDE